MVCLCLVVVDLTFSAYLLNASQKFVYFKDIFPVQPFSLDSTESIAFFQLCLDTVTRLCEDWGHWDPEIVSMLSTFALQTKHLIAD